LNRKAPIVVRILSRKWLASHAAIGLPAQRAGRRHRHRAFARVNTC